MTRNTTELRDCPQAASKWSLKDDTGYQYRYTSVTRPLKGTVHLHVFRECSYSYRNMT